MPDIETKGQPRMLSDMAAAAQASAGRSLNFSRGKIMRAIAESFAAIALWFQAQMLKVLASTRLATSSSGDVDTFLADYGVSRIPAGFARGVVTFSRAVTTSAAFIPVGAMVRTVDATQTFMVAADASNPAYSAAPAGYTIAAGAASLDVPVIAIEAGTGGNVNAGTVTLIASSISGVDNVTNALAFAGGVAEETDAQAKARFPLYLASLSKATEAAVNYAISQVQAGLRWKTIRNVDASGATAAGHFLVVVDSGDGTADMSLINRVGDAINTTVALGITFEVVGVTPVMASVSMSITTAAGVVHADAVAAVAAALRAYIGTLGIGDRLPYSRLSSIAYGAAPGQITNVTAILLNGGTADLVPTVRQRAIANVITVS